MALSDQEIESLVDSPTQPSAPQDAESLVADHENSQAIQHVRDNPKDPFSGVLAGRLVQSGVARPQDFRNDGVEPMTMLRHPEAVTLHGMNDDGVIDLNSPISLSNPDIGSLSRITSENEQAKKERIAAAPKFDPAGYLANDLYKNKDYDPDSSVAAAISGNGNLGVELPIAARVKQWRAQNPEQTTTLQKVADFGSGLWNVGKGLVGDIAAPWTGHGDEAKPGLVQGIVRGIGNVGTHLMHGDDDAGKIMVGQIPPCRCKQPLAKAEALIVWCQIQFKNLAAVRQ